MRVSFHTFGCKLNQYETEALASAFRNQGFSLATGDQDAEIHVINTCTVTSKSEQKARRLIRRLSRLHPGALLLVTGCYAQLNPQEMADLGSNVRVVPQEQKASLLDLPAALKRGGGLHCAPMDAGHLSAAADPFRYRVDRFSFHSRAFLKVQDGCDYRCSYCRVPLARGRSVSLDPELALQRAQQLEETGYREIVLTGVNLSAYRFQRYELPQLLTLLLSGTSGLRFRLSSLEPERIEEPLTEALSDPRVRPHFHIPIQSGSDPLLSKMRRRYRSEQVRRAVTLLRAAKADPFLAADIIAGFPGETEEDFRASCRLVETLQLSKLHVFPFSPRPGTAAQHFPAPVPERIRDQHVQSLLRISEQLHRRYTARWIGRDVEAVLEADSGESTKAWRGLSANYLKLEVRGLPQRSAQPGNLVLVRIEQPGDPCTARFIEAL